MLILEDLEWADDATLTLIERYLGRSEFVRICLIVSARPEPRSPEVAAVMDALERARAVMLRPQPLPADAAREFARQLLRGKQPGPNLTRQLERAGGNPLFIVELVTALEEFDLVTDRGDEAESDATTLPPSLRLTILRRLAALGDPVVSLLKNAAVLGRRFDIMDLAALSHLTLPEVLERLEAARRAALIQDEAGGLAFRHDVIRDALYDDIPESARRALHTHVSDVLAAREADPVEIAEHVVRGIERGDVETAQRLRIAAARLRTTAPRDAIRLLDLALDAARDHPERGTIEAELADVCMWVGQPQRAEELARRALDRGHVTLTTSVALMRAVVQQNEPEHTVATIDLLLERNAGRAAEARIQAEAAQGLSTSGAHHDRARAASFRALELAGEEDPTATMLAEITLGYLANYHGYLAEATEHSARALQAATNDPTEEALRRAPHLTHGFHLNLSGRSSDAEEVLREGVATAQRLGTEWAIPSYHLLAGAIYDVQGRWDEAETELAAGIRHAKELGVSVQLLNAYMFLAELLVERGELGRARGLLDQAGLNLTPDEASRLPSPFARWGGRRFLDEAEGRFDDVATRAAATIDLIEKTDYVFVYRPAGIDLVRALVRVDRRDEAKLVVERLHWLVEGGGPNWFCGDAECAAGLVNEDVDALLAAVDHYRDSEWPFRLATGLVDAARALKKHDNSRAADLLQEAAEIFERLGALRRAHGCAAALRELGVRRGVRGARKRATVGWDALTERELSIARLVADGLSNPEIAERLFISRRTVEVHLGHIFSKLNLTSRTRLATEVVKRRSLANGAHPR